MAITPANISKCVEGVKDWYVDQTVEESLGKVSREEAGREVEEEIDWRGLKEEEFEKNELGLVACEDDPKLREGLGVLRHLAPDLHARVIDKCVSVSERYFPTVTSAVGVTVPYTQVVYADKQLHKAAIVVFRGITNHMSPKSIARTLGHEAGHLDLDENPEKYGIKSYSEFFVRKMLGELEDPVNVKLEKMGLPMSLHAEQLSAKDKAWKQARYKIWPEDAVLRIVACVYGKPAYMKKEWEFGD